MTHHHNDSQRVLRVWDEQFRIVPSPPTNIALEESKWIEYYPVSSTLNSDTAPIEFEIKGQGYEYVDLSQNYVQLVCKFTKDNGADLTGQNSFSTPANKIVHSLISEIDISLNVKVITPGDRHLSLQSLSGETALLRA